MNVRDNVAEYGEPGNRSRRVNACPRAIGEVKKELDGILFLQDNNLPRARVLYFFSILTQYGNIIYCRNIIKIITAPARHEDAPA